MTTIRARQQRQQSTKSSSGSGGSGGKGRGQHQLGKDGSGYGGHAATLEKGSILSNKAIQKSVPLIGPISSDAEKAVEYKFCQPFESAKN